MPPVRVFASFYRAGGAQSTEEAQTERQAMTSYNLHPIGALCIPELRRDDVSLSRSDLDVLRALVTFWNCPDIRPSQTTIAERAGVSKRTAVDAIRHLKDAGAVRVTEGAAGGTCYYALNLSAVLSAAGLLAAGVPDGWYAGFKRSLPTAEEIDEKPAIRPLTPVPSRVTEDIIAEQSAKRIAKQKAEVAAEQVENAKLSEFNTVYPRGAALPGQWAEARRHAEASTLIRAAKAYAAQCKRRHTQERYITLARNWLKNRAWEELLPNGGEVELTGRVLRDLPGDAQVAMSRAERAAEDAWDEENKEILYSGGLTGAMSTERARCARDARRKAAAEWVAANDYDVALHLN